MQNKSSDQDKTRLKRKHDHEISDLTIKNKKIKIINEDDKGQSIKGNARTQEKNQNLNKSDENLNQKESNLESKKDHTNRQVNHQIDLQTNSQTNPQINPQVNLQINSQINLQTNCLQTGDDLQINRQNNDLINYQNESATNLLNNKTKSQKTRLDYQPISSTANSTCLKYYLNQMNQLTNEEIELDKVPMNLNKSEIYEERSNDAHLKMDNLNQLNYVQLLNYHHCLMQKYELNKYQCLDESIDKFQSIDKTSLPNQLNQLKTKLTNNYSLNDQQLSQLNSQLINSPAFKQLIEKNRTLRLNLAYQKLQADNPNFAFPLRTVRPCRRQRTTFTNEQTIKLEIEYRQSEYISRNKRFQLADLLDLSENQIKIWFQNRRAKDKRLERAILDQQLKTIWN